MNSQKARDTQTVSTSFDYLFGLGGFYGIHNRFHSNAHKRPRAGQISSRGKAVEKNGVDSRRNVEVGPLRRKGPSSRGPDRPESPARGR